MLRAFLHWLCPPRGEHDLDPEDLDLQLAIAKTRRELENHITTHCARLENLIVTSAQDLVARLDAATNEIAADLQAARDAAITAVAGKDQAVQEAVAAALAPIDAGVARLEALGQDPADPVPTDPATPAEEPAPVAEPVVDANS